MDDIGVTLRQLRCVAAVADVGSVTLAAGLLGLAQPSVSQQVARLEGELGVALFRRGARRMVPTPAGELVVAMARDVLGRVEGGIGSARRRAGGAPPTLTVGTVSSLATSLFPDAVVLWRDQHGARPLRLREALRRTDLEASVRAGDIELAVSAPPADWAGLVVTVGDEELGLVVTPGRRASFGASARLSSFAEDPWVLYDPDHGLAEPVLRACAEAGFAPREVLRTLQVDTAVRMAAAGVGVTVAPTGSVPVDVAGLLVRCRPRLRSPVAVWGLPGTEADAERLATVLRPALARRPGGRADAD